MRFNKFSNLANLLTTSHLFSAHTGLDGRNLRKVGPLQYAVHWVYGISEPMILKMVDYLLAKKMMTDTPLGQSILQLIATIRCLRKYYLEEVDELLTGADPNFCS